MRVVGALNMNKNLKVLNSLIIISNNLRVYSPTMNKNLKVLTSLVINKNLRVVGFLFVNKNLRVLKCQRLSVD